MNQIQKMLGENVSLDQLNIKMQSYNDLCSKLRLLLLNEESKRGIHLLYMLALYSELYTLIILKIKEKSYFNSDNDSKVSQIYQAFSKCLEDYQSEIKHSKIIIKEVNSCLYFAFKFYDFKINQFFFHLSFKTPGKTKRNRRKSYEKSNPRKSDFRS